ncbi:MAG: hypothetical protein ACRES7_00215 [Gammaproteobacteria bacterium]
MLAFNKFNAFVLAVATKKIDLNADTLKIMLTDTASVVTNSVKTDITEISAGNGYSAGGAAVGSNSASQTSGTMKVVGDAVTFTASGGAIAQFRYLVLYDDTAASKDLIGWWDNGSEVNLGDGSSFTLGDDFSGDNWDATTPLFTLA